MADQTRNVFVLGLDDRNLALMQNLPNASSLRFHRLLTREELMYIEAPVGELLDRARDELNSFDSTIDAIVGYWDFPVSSMVPVLCREYGLPGPSLEAVLKCEHKYWSRIEQRKVALSFPPFELVSLENDPEPPRLNYPYWLKPVKSYSSAFAYKISSAEQFHQAAQEIRTGMEYIGEAFDHFLDQAEVPAEVAAAGGSACLAEEQVSGQQITAEGYSYRGRPHVYGIIDSICYPDTPSFLRYQYPTQLPGEIVQRVTDVSCRVIKQIGLDNSAFNIEFFWDGERDRINILEINPRISQSHAPLFTYVDGCPTTTAWCGWRSEKTRTCRGSEVSTAALRSGSGVLFPTVSPNACPAPRTCSGCRKKCPARWWTSSPSGTGGCPNCPRRTATATSSPPSTWALPTRSSCGPSTRNAVSCCRSRSSR